MSKSNKRVAYYYAMWDSNAVLKKRLVEDECARQGIRFEAIDVESKLGVQMSIKNEVRNVPTAIIYKGMKIVGVEKGNQIHERIVNYR